MLNPLPMSSSDILAKDARLFRRLVFVLLAIVVSFTALWCSRSALGLWSAADDLARVERKADKISNFWQRPTGQAVRPRLRRVRVSLQGLACGTCSKPVVQALRALPGVWRIEVRFQSGDALVDYDPATTTMDALLDAPTDVGFPATSWTEGRWLSP